MRPHVEQKSCNFCLSYKNWETSKKNQERAFFGHFWIDTKKIYSIQIFKPGRNIMSLFIRNIQILTKSKIKDTFFSLTPYTQEPKSSKIHFSRHHNVEIPYHILATQRMNLRKFLWKVREIRASLRLKELLSLHHVWMNLSNPENSFKIVMVLGAIIWQYIWV